jgi:hypothetical protein
MDMQTGQWLVTLLMLALGVFVVVYSKRYTNFCNRFNQKLPWSIRRFIPAKYLKSYDQFEFIAGVSACYLFGLTFIIFALYFAYEILTGHMKPLFAP